MYVFVASILGIIGIGLIFDSAEFDGFIYTFLGILLVSIATAIFTFYITQDLNSPKAIDVYRGNTTLEITYRDSIPVDTVVVFKK